MNATTIDQRPKCSECGGYDVETTAWIEYRDDGTAAIVNGEGPFGDESGNWCHDCQEHVHLDYPDFTPADRDAVAAADRAREHGPELLAALKILRVQIGDYRDGQGAAKFHACNIADAAIAKAEGKPDAIAS